MLSALSPSCVSPPLMAIADNPSIAKAGGRLMEKLAKRTKQYHTVMDRADRKASLV